MMHRCSFCKVKENCGQDCIAGNHKCSNCGAEISVLPYVRCLDPTCSREFPDSDAGLIAMQLHELFHAIDVLVSTVKGRG